MIFKGIKFRGKSVITSSQITERFYNTDISLRFSNRIDKLTEWLNKRLYEIEKLELKKQWVQDEIELLSNDEYQEAFTYLQKKRGDIEDSFEDIDQEKKFLARMIVRKKLKPIRKWIRTFRFIDYLGIYKQLFVEPTRINLWSNEKTPNEWVEICQMTMKMLSEGKLNYEDATPFLLLKEMIQGFQTNTTIKHVFVDEAQDYSPFQFEFLKRLFPNAKMTILGDFNQAIFAHARDTVDFHTLTTLYGKDETETIKLTCSYRSTRPITEFTRELVPDGERIQTFNRDGDIPILTRLSNYEQLHHYIVSKVSELQKKEYNTIAIICKSAEECAIAYDALKNIDEIKLVKQGSIEYEQGVVVIPAYLAKGIEFDAVIIYNASAHIYGVESLRRLFYTACTRAMHSLQLYCVGEPSPFLTNIAPEKMIQRSN